MKMSRALSFYLKHQIIFLENFAASDIEKENWQEKTMSFAEIKPLCDSKFESLENINFGHVMTEGFFIFKIRFIDGINSKMRILFKKRIFEIKRIIDVEEQGRILNIIGLEI